MATATTVDWEPVIGLEVHAQMRTKTKLFCGCANRFGDAPNTNVCPVCLGLPGSLPVMNGQAFDFALKTALALNCEIARFTKSDRKNYYYPDLPKNYQISQYDLPFSSKGWLDIVLPGGEKKRIGITRVHLEEDAGKLMHDELGGGSGVDLNRAGTPLIEIVSEPDLRSPAEARAYMEALAQLLEYLGVCDCNMQEGSLRCDANVSIRPPGQAKFNTRREIKNMNSFRFVEAAVEKEIAEQKGIYASGGAVRQETRLFNGQTGEIRTMRAKEEASDYRYFPEPDLVPFHLDPAFVEKQRSMLPELPAARRARYQSQFGLSAYDAGVLTSSRALADFFETTVKLSGNPKESANWIANGVLANLSDPAITAKSVDELPFRAHDLAELIELVANQTIHNNVGRTVLRGMFESGKSPRQIVKEQGLEQVSDEGQLESWCREALVGKDKVIADVKAGKTKAVAALMGPVMKASKGSANPQKVQEILLRIIQTEL